MNTSRLFNAALAALALVLTGCGTVRHEQRTVSAGNGTEWRAQGEAAGAPLQLGAPSIEGGTLALPLQTRRIEREFAFDLQVVEGRRTQDASLLKTVTLSVATFGLGCALMSDDCFGKTGEWRGGDAQRVNERPTGRTRALVQPNAESVTALVSVEGVDANGTRGARIERTVRTRDGELRVPLKTLAEQMPQRPAQLEVVVALTERQREPARFTIEPERVAAMRLQAEAWLPPEQRRTLILARLKPLLVDGKHAAAVAQYEALAALELPLPESFHWFFAQSLREAGQAEKARAALERYQALSGGEGAYSEAARAQLAQR